PNSLYLDETADALIEEGGETWNEGLIRSVFRFENAELILNIPLELGTSDVFRWHYERNGQYWVRSADSLLTRAGVARSVPSSSVKNMLSWNIVWHAVVSPEVMLFAWEVCGDALLVLSPYRSAECILTKLSSVCNLEDNTLHVLLRCHFSCLVWALSGLPCRSLSCGHSSAEFWVRGVHSALDKEGFRRALLVCLFLCDGLATNSSLKIFILKLTTLWNESQVIRQACGFNIWGRRDLKRLGKPSTVSRSLMLLDNFFFL
ncbi:UNVERIFIED_CONTAM: hypothetical protein Sangu_0515300, partial [Sesamum angustifolium]